MLKKLSTVAELWNLCSCYLLVSFHLVITLVCLVMDTSMSFKSILERARLSNQIHFSMIWQEIVIHDWRWGDPFTCMNMYKDVCVLWILGGKTRVWHIGCSHKWPESDTMPYWYHLSPWWLGLVVDQISKSEFRIFFFEWDLNINHGNSLTQPNRLAASILWRGAGRFNQKSPWHAKILN